MNIILFESDRSNVYGQRGSNDEEASAREEKLDGSSGVLKKRRESMLTRKNIDKNAVCQLPIKFEPIRQRTQEVNQFRFQISG